MLRQYPRLLSVATAVPDNILNQNDVAAAATRIFAERYPDFSRMTGVFDSSGIDKRHASRPIEWYIDEHGWADRTAVYLEVAGDLFVKAATAALDKAGLTADDVDTVITISSTGIATPSLESRIAGRMGFRTGVRRVPVFGLGCAGGVSGLSLAARLAAADPGSTVLVVAVELCTLAFRLDQLTKASVISSALFADGAAACIVRVGVGGIGAITASGEHQWPSTLDIMGWNVDGIGLDVILARSVPHFAESKVRPALIEILDRIGYSLEDFGRIVCHPGGAKVLDGLEKAFGLPVGGLDHERDIIREYGNMSAPTVLFILERVIAAGLPPRVAMTALGPGFTLSALVLERS